MAEVAFLKANETGARERAPVFRNMEFNFYKTAACDDDQQKETQHAFDHCQLKRTSGTISFDPFCCCSSLSQPAL